MIKRFSKKQGSKQGVILLTVVFILAMAVIFISACMVMTQATRNRLYWKAEQSQARLTVTSAAEAFYQALEVGDFQEVQLKKLAKAGASGILMTAKDSSGNYLPGMSTSADNCTLLSLKAKDADCSEIYAYLTTTIDGETEKVKITFKVKKKPKVYGLFGNPVDYNGSPNKFNFEDFGYANGQNPTDNFLVIRNGSNVDDSSTMLWSNVVFTSGSISDFRVDMKGGADIILLGNAKLGSISCSLGTTNSWYFVGQSGNNDALTSDTMLNQLGASGAVAFANRNINKSLTNVSTIPVYTISLDTNYNPTGATQYSGSLALADDALSTVKDNASMYANKTFEESIGSFPTTSEAFAQIKLGDDSLPASAPSSFTALSFADFLAYGNTTSGGTKILGDTNSDGICDTPNIRVTGGGNFGTSLNNGTRYVFLLDGSSDYVIYLQGSGNTYGLYQATFAVVNPDSTHKQVFVLENGVNLDICCNNAKEIGAGFLSVTRDTYSATASAYSTYIFGDNLIGEMTKKSPGSTKPTGYSTYWDSVKKPTIYILGAGNNQVMLNAGAVVEAYVGLFNPDSTTNSGIGCYNDSQYVYGRMMFDSWTSGGDGGKMYMPYCPGPNAEGAKPDVELYKFGYSVVSVDYYFTD